MFTLSDSRDLGKANQTPLPRRLALALGMSVPAALALVPLASSPDYYEILVSGSQGRDFFPCSVGSWGDLAALLTQDCADQLDPKTLSSHLIDEFTN